MALYSVVIPVYNSEQSLREIYRRLADVFDNQIGEPFELILVDDCSSDNSYSIIKQLVKEDDRVKGIQLAVNHGQQKAVLCGMRYVSGDYVITMDDDLQHPPEEIPKLIDAITKTDEADVIIGAYESKKHNLIRNFGTWLMNLSNRIIYGKPNRLKLTSFRIMKRFVADNLCGISIAKPIVGPLLLQTTKRIQNVTVKHDQRQYGHSGYTFGKLCRTFFSDVFTNSDLPLKIIGKIGVLSFVASIVLIIFYIVRYFINKISITGWTSLVVLILFFGGMTLFAMGIIGRYLTNLMLETKKYPACIIRRCDFSGKGSEKKI